MYEKEGVERNIFIMVSHLWVQDPLCVTFKLSPTCPPFWKFRPPKNERFMDEKKLKPPKRPGTGLLVKRKITKEQRELVKETSSWRRWKPSRRR